MPDEEELRRLRHLAAFLGDCRQASCKVCADNRKATEKMLKRLAKLR
jgi:hypothetical protein